MDVEKVKQEVYLYRLAKYEHFKVTRNAGSSSGTVGAVILLLWVVIALMVFKTMSDDVGSLMNAHPILSFAVIVIWAMVATYTTTNAQEYTRLRELNKPVNNDPHKEIVQAMNEVGIGYDTGERYDQNLRRYINFLETQ